MWEHIFWGFGHPEVYILIMPAFGMASEIIPVFSRKPIFGYTFVAFSGVAIAFISFLVWAHHMFTTGLTQSEQAFLGHDHDYRGAYGVKILNWCATMYGGAIRWTTAMKYCAAFILQFTIGGISGVMFAVVPWDYASTDSYFVVAHFHYVLFGAPSSWCSQRHIIGSQDDRQVAQRAHRKLELLADGRGFQSHILSPALPARDAGVSIPIPIRSGRSGTLCLPRGRSSRLLRWPCCCTTCGIVFAAGKKQVPIHGMPGRWSG
jgi:hypothetical protein